MMNIRQISINLQYMRRSQKIIYLWKFTFFGDSWDKDDSFFLKIRVGFC